MQSAAQMIAAMDAVPEAVDPACRAWWVARLDLELRLQRPRPGPRYLHELPPWLRATPTATRAPLPRC